jgi:predicted dithiol-disulfide oxidoreductase (DUF899 family)
VSLPEIVSREAWLEARRELLAQEKELTRARDALNVRRRLLPMVEIDKVYAFEGPEGAVGLPDLFAGHRQMLVSHFMFDPAWDDGCPSCSAGADEMSDGLRRHLEVRDTRLVYVSRAPLPKLEDYRARRAWSFPWYSSFGSDFNYDFHVTLDERVAPMEYNYRSAADLQGTGDQPFEMPGLSVFMRQGDRVFHTYSSFARGAEWTGGSYAFLDLTPLGRQEDWEEPRGRSETPRDARPDFAT